jgi:hypothetical protein
MAQDVDVESGDMSTEARRKRNRSRRKFFKMLADESNGGDTSDTGGSILSESFGGVGGSNSIFSSSGGPTSTYGDSSTYGDASFSGDRVTSDEEPDEDWEDVVEKQSRDAI